MERSERGGAQAPAAVLHSLASCGACMGGHFWQADVARTRQGKLLPRRRCCSCLQLRKLLLCRL